MFVVVSVPARNQRRVVQVAPGNSSCEETMYGLTENCRCIVVLEAPVHNWTCGVPVGALCVVGVPPSAWIV